MGKRLVIHFGMHKTGTSAIQSWMEYLSNEGLGAVHYAQSGRDGNAHHRLAQELKMFGDLSSVLELKREARATDRAVTLISAEGLSKLHSSEVCDLLSVLLDPADGFDVGALVWLRRPDHYIEACFSQLVKSGRDAAPTMQMLVERVDAGKMFIDTLRPWVEQLGVDHVHIHPYERQRWPDGSLWSAWWQALDLAAPCAESDLPCSIREANVSPSVMTLAVVAELSRRLAQKRVAIRQMWFFIQNVVNPVQQRLAELWPEIAALRLSMFSPSLREQMLDQWECHRAASGLLMDAHLWWGPGAALATSPQSNVEWVLDPARMPAGYRRCYSELLDYAGSLADRVSKADCGVFY